MKVKTYTNSVFIALLFSSRLFFHSSSSSHEKNDHKENSLLPASFEKSKKKASIAPSEGC
jgi:hypothetical protein